jgi:xylose isomerase
MKKRQDATGVKLLWGTANVFGNPRFMNGAATNPEFAVVAQAANQVKNAIDGAIKLGASGIPSGAAVRAICPCSTRT